MATNNNANSNQQSKSDKSFAYSITIVSFDTLLFFYMDDLENSRLESKFTYDRKKYQRTKNID